MTMDHWSVVNQVFIIIIHGLLIITCVYDSQRCTTHKIGDEDWFMSFVNENKAQQTSRVEFSY